MRKFKPSLLLILLFALFLISMCLFAMSRVSPNSIDPEPFPTEIFPSRVFWGDDENLFYIEENVLLSFNVNSQTHQVEYTPQTGAILTEFIEPYGQKSFILQHSDKTEITIEDNYGGLQTAFYPLATGISARGSLVCLCYNFKIFEPTQTATKIDIYEILADTTIVKARSVTSTLTLRPLGCDKNSLLLTTPIPDLSKIVYQWDLDTPTPIPITIDMYDPAMGSFVEISPDGQLILLTSLTGERLIYNPGSQISTPIDSTTLVFPGHSGEIFTLDNTGEQYTLTQNTNILASFSATPTFTKFIPSPNGKVFAMISTSGELWILPL